MVNRNQETREAKSRKQGWRPPSVLPVPDKQDGYAYRWVRVGSRGNSDNRNASKRFREGWVPVNISDHPELKAISDRGSEYSGGVEIGGLLLCKTSKENVEQRNRYYQGVAHTQINSIDNNYMRESDPRMPLSKPERRTRVTFGAGSED